METVFWENINADSLSIGVQLLGSEINPLKPLTNDWFASMRIGYFPDSFNSSSSEICIDESSEYFICGCRNGFQYNNKSCQDIDECASNITVCPWNNSLCINTVGSYECSCKSGRMYMENACYDIDECANGSMLCVLNNGICVNTAGGYFCEKMCSIGSFAAKREMILHTNNPIALFKLLRKEYEIVFQVKPLQVINGNVSVVQLSQGDQYTNGSRVLAVWIVNGVLMFCSDIVVGANTCFTRSESVELGSWLTIKVFQKCLENGTCSYSVLVDGMNVYTAINAYPRELSNLTLYASDPWLNPLNGTIRNLCIEGVDQDNRMLLREFYLGDNKLPNPTNITKFPRSPDTYGFLDVFDAPLNVDEHYVQRIRGWFQPLMTGNYTFYSACDDYCWFYLSSNEDPANKSMIISQQSPVYYLAWTWYANQASKPVFLQANHRYYMETVFWEKNNGDNLSIGVQLLGSETNPLKPITNSWFASMRIGYFPDSSNSSANEVCIDESSNYFICGCKNGFQYDNKSSICQDIDECAGNIMFCPWNNSLCINTVGSYECSCKSGWMYMENACYDIDECANGSLLCVLNNGICVNTVGGYFCEEMCRIGSFAAKREMILHTNNPIAVFKLLRKEYEIVFQVKPLQVINGNVSVIQLSQGGQYTNGSRVLAVWIVNGVLMFCSDIVVGANTCFTRSGSVVLGSWLTIKVFQKCLENGTCSYSVLVDGMNVYTAINAYPREFSNMTLYASDPWLNPLGGTIRNLCIEGVDQDNRMLLREFYLGDNKLPNPTNITKFPRNPDTYGFLDVFDAPLNVDEHYVQRIRGWFQPLTTGNYSFYSACDDYCWFYLSSNEDPANKTMIISQESPVLYLEWAQQVPKPFFLRANHRYYMETVFWENFNADSLSIGVQLLGSETNPLKPLTNDWFASMRIGFFPDSFNSSSSEICIDESSEYFICGCRNGFQYDHESSKCQVVLSMVGIDVLVQKNLFRDEVFEMIVTVFNGSKMILEVDFGDRSSLIVTKIDEDQQAVNYTFSYSYSKCGKYQISVLIKDNQDSTMENISTNVSVIVFCYLSPMNITTDSTMYVNRTLLVLKRKEVSLYIKQDFERNVHYAIDWGDGFNESFDLSDNLKLLPFVCTHAYSDVGKHVILVVASNGVYSFNKSIDVLVRNCTVPMVNFYYGTKTNPIYFLQSVDKTFIASVDEISDECKRQPSSFEWALTSSGLELKSKAALVKQKVVYTVKKQQLQAGSYALSLLFTYGDIESVYTTYFVVVKSPLFVEAENGVSFRVVSYKKKVGNDSINANFTISANSSYDPDNQAAGLDGISFKWRCQLATDLAYAFAHLNETANSSVDGNTCFNSSWVDLTDLTGPEVVFDTGMFYESFSYRFEVVGAKGMGEDIRTSSFVHEIMFSKNEIPDVKLSCYANCGRKLNVKERTIFFYECLDCGNKRLDAFWKVSEEDGTSSGKHLQTNKTQSFDNSFLVINGDVLLQSKNYTFFIEIGYSGSSSKSLFTIKKQTSSSPTPGSCFVDPHKGLSMTTKFKLICQDWTDLDGNILSYHFFYGEFEDDLTSSFNMKHGFLKLNANSVDQPSLIDFVLGAGKKSKNCSITILVQVSGLYSMYTEYNLAVQVFPNDKLLNVSEIVLDADLNDTQVASNIIQSFGISVNVHSNYIESLTLKSRDDFTGLVSVDEELTQEKVLELVQLQKMRSESINIISQLPLRDLNDFKNVADTLDLLTRSPKELLPDSQDVAADVIVKMADLLTKENIKRFNFYEFLALTEPFLEATSNLFSANLNIATQHQTFEGTLKEQLSTTPTGSKKVSVQVVSKLLQSLDNVFYAILSFKAPVENATIVDTHEFSLVANKRFGYNLSEIAIGMPPVSGEDDFYGFTFSDAESFLNTSAKATVILLNNLRMKNQPFFWDSETSQNIASESEHLSLSTPERLPIELNNLQQPIIIAIKNIPEKLTGQNISLSTPEDAQVYSLALTSDLCNMMLSFRPLNDPENLTTLFVYMQYGKVPSKNDYDVKLIVNKNGTVLSINPQTAIINVSASYGNNLMNKYSKISVNPQANITASDAGVSLSIERHQQAKLLKDGNIVLWSFQNSTYAFLNKTALFFSLFYDGPMPNKTIEANPYTFDIKEYKGNFEYELKSFCSQCSYWDETKSKWMSDGCELDIETTTFSTTVCKCTHLTAFAGFYVKPNVLQTPSLLLIKQGYVLLVVIASVLMIWILGLVFARQIDKKDATKIGVCPLLDNRKEDSYMYQITVNTGNRRNAGTKSNIFFTVVGELDDSGVRRLKDSKRSCFQRSSSDTFIMTTSDCLGDLCYIRLWHDNKGGGWYLRNIEVVDIQTKRRFHFFATRWLSVEHEECSLDCVLPVTASEEMSQFDHQFSIKVRHGFFENHLWFSILARPPGSNFTRCQRLSVAVSLLLTGMTASTMFFGREFSVTKSIENKSEGFAISWRHVYVAFICACITIPINLIFIGVFRHTKPYKKPSNKAFSEKDSSAENSSKNASSDSSISIEFDHLNNTRSIRRKKSFKLPHWFLHITWFICVGTILSCSSIVILYGMSFGNKKSLDWLATVTLCLAQDVFLFQPMKIFAAALFSALSIKAIGARRKRFTEMYTHGNALEFDRKLLYQPKQEATIFERDDIDTNPPDKFSVLAMQESRLKQLRLNQISHELVLYTWFAFLVFFISYFSRESLAYFHADNVKKLFNLKSSGADVSQPLDQLRSADDFWYWLDNCLLPQAFPDPWYKNREDFPGKLLLNDLTSKIVNGIRIRQVRVKHDSCFKAESVSEFFVLECLSAYKVSVEEKQDFAFNWTTPKQYGVPNNSSTIPWRYQSSNQLDGYPVSATLETYYGGGYVVEIFPKWKNDKILDQVKQRRWIDRQTRVVFTEFALFNAATKNFCVVNIIFEFPPSGGMVPSYFVTPIQLYESSENKTIMRASQALFILMMFFFSVREIKLMHKCGGKYFHEFWNLVEVALVLLSMLAVFFYYYRGELAKQITERLSDRHPQVFINLQLLSFFDLSYTYATSLIVFFVNIKFLKMLRFNCRISMLSSTLKGAWPALSMFGIIFAIILFAIVFSSCITFGVLLHGYQDYFQTTASVVSLLLGKFDFHQFEEANAFLGPIFFFGFNIFVNLIIVSMFVSILNDSIEVVRSSNTEQNDDVAVIEFLLRKMKSWFCKMQKLPVVQSNQSFKPFSAVHQDQFRCVDFSGTETNWFCYNLRMEAKFSKYKYLFEDEKQKSDVANETLTKFIHCMTLLWNKNEYET